MLVITNGSSAAHLISSVVEDASVLPWNDVLHDGPVPALDLTDLSDVRAEYLQQFVPDRDVLAEFRDRDNQLGRFKDHEEVILCFEHDLYDILQLSQLLDYFASKNTGSTKISIAQAATFIGESSLAEIDVLIRDRIPVTSAVLDAGKMFWSIFTSSNHDRLTKIDWSAMSFLPGCVHRLLEEYPSTFSGLGRSRQQILDVLANGDKDPVGLFIEHSNLESAKYLGDSSFFGYVKELVEAPYPLVRCNPSAFKLPGQGSSFANQQLGLTAFGKDVQSGRKDALDMNGIYQWIGGVRLSSKSKRIPRWDAKRYNLV